MRTLFLSLLLLSGLLQTQGQSFPSFEKRWLIHNQDTLPYRVQYPLNYKPSRKYPLVLFLHGAGERGSDNNFQLFWGADLLADPVNRMNFPAIVIFPQCASADYWANVKRVPKSPTQSRDSLLFPSDLPARPSLSLVQRLLDSLIQNKIVQAKRIYLGGLSMGGMGTFELLWRMPGTFAAAFPICGGGDPAQVPLYGSTPAIRIFHGSEDVVVDPACSRLMYQALKQAGADVQYTEYPGVGHDSWKKAFAEPDFLPWIFAQRKKRK